MLAGHTRHHKAHIVKIPVDSDQPEPQYTTFFHPKLTAQPCDENGGFLLEFVKPTPTEPADAKPGNPFHPFPDHHGFDWMHFHFVELQASDSKINHGLDLWQAALISSGGTTSIPWASAREDIIAEDPKTHGAMFVPIVAGSDKPTVSAATRHQEYHPVYQSPGNLINSTRCGHSVAVSPVAFIPILKIASNGNVLHSNDLFDKHFWRAIYGLGPYIADYPEQVVLAGIVQNWCAKGDSQPDDLDSPNKLPRSHDKTDFLLNTFDPGILWDEYVLILHFSHLHMGFHQVIKGVFKDHIVTWVMEYLFIKHGEARALEIIEDIGWRISAWTGDDSKALMKVYIAAIAGHVPSKMVQCV
ncbi:hypothetical protein C8J56DRAFT_1050261 [Mycena floridula]|nr:hypothetical protein C8J56DRAFT_1050261 [Mycena floridula]